jgi:uncharacterized membrane protein
MKNFSKLLLIASIFTPIFVSAQQYGAPVIQSLGAVSQVVGVLYGLMPVVAVLAFFAGVAWYVWKKMTGGEADNKVLIWGVIALAVLFSLYGIIRVLANVVGATNNAAISAPAVPRPATR